MADETGAGAKWCSFQDGAGSIIPSQTYRLSKYSVFYYVRAMSTGFKIAKSSLSFFLQQAHKTSHKQLYILQELIGWKGA